jgi:Tat protein secretion system quality control protein TatD with DNase activity
VGKSRNTSLIIPNIAKRISEIKDIYIAEVERVTTENVKRVFNIN